jgi:prepilin-type N-terminal cleavage/methylation domain-containing protein
MKLRCKLNMAGDAAFTLLEVLVSSAVLAIVMAIMFSALSTSMNLWRNTENKIVADREARSVELMLVRDLANAVVPASTNLWPTIESPRRSSTQYLKFLTAAPATMQSSTGSEVGDVCYVEYAVVASSNGVGREVRRLFWASGATYSNILRSVNPRFPTNDAESASFQSLGLNILPTNTMAARGLGSLASVTNMDVSFRLIGSNMLAFSGSPSISNYPVAVEVNFAVADPDTLANTNIIGSPNYILRNAGLYSFRIPLPRPPNAP